MAHGERKRAVRAGTRLAAVAAHVSPHATAAATTGGAAAEAGGSSSRAEALAALEASAKGEGRLVGVSEWLKVEQPRVDAFADCTNDHQFIHEADAVEKGSPFPAPIAHGYLSMCLVASAAGKLVASQVSGAAASVNYGVEKLRFRAPVPVGTSVRARCSLVDIQTLPQVRAAPVARAARALACAARSCLCARRGDVLTVARSQNKAGLWPARVTMGIEAERDCGKTPALGAHLIALLLFAES